MEKEVWVLKVMYEDNMEDYLCFTTEENAIKRIKEIKVNAKKENYFVDFGLFQSNLVIDEEWLND